MTSFLCDNLKAKDIWDKLSNEIIKWEGQIVPLALLKMTLLRFQIALYEATPSIIIIKHFYDKSCRVLTSISLTLRFGLFC